MESFYNEHWVLLCSSQAFAAGLTLLGAAAWRDSRTGRVCWWLHEASLVLPLLVGWHFELAQPGGEGYRPHPENGPVLASGLPYHFTMPTALVVGLLPAHALFIGARLGAARLRRTAVALGVIPLPIVLSLSPWVLFDVSRLWSPAALLGFLGHVLARLGTAPWLAASALAAGISAVVSLRSGSRRLARPVLAALASTAAGLALHGLGEDHGLVIEQVLPPLGIATTAGALTLLALLALERWARPREATDGHEKAPHLA